MSNNSNTEDFDDAFFSEDEREELFENYDNNDTSDDSDDDAFLEEIFKDVEDKQESKDISTEKNISGAFKQKLAKVMKKGTYNH